jgi:hypothetical protein
MVIKFAYFDYFFFSKANFQTLHVLMCCVFFLQILGRIPCGTVIIKM